MLTRLTPRNGNAVLSLEDCKDHLRVTHGDEDAQIGRLRDAAIVEVERGSGIALSQADFRWTLPRFRGAIILPVRPVIEVLAVTYGVRDGTATYDDWHFADGKVLSSSRWGWPVVSGFAAVEFTAGLADPNDEPDLIAIVLRLLAHSYDNRSSEVPPSLLREIASHRQVLV